MPKLLDEVRDSIRVRHYSIRTEEAYIRWIKEYIFFHKKRHPVEMGEREVSDFLSHLAVNRRVAASTQTQALSALLFLYRNVLKQPLDWLNDIERAKKPSRLPVVFSRIEAHAVLAHLDGSLWLMASLLYGSGLRLMECLRLRIKDVDFELNQIIVRDGKGGRDRVTVLPESVKTPMHRHLAKVKALHESDLKEGFGEVYLPYALEKKYRNASREWCWQYVFPAAKRSVDPRSGSVRRHHVDERVLQKAVKSAIQASGIAKPGSCHSFRHYAEFRTMPSRASDERECPGMQVPP